MEGDEKKEREYKIMHVILPCIPTIERTESIFIANIIEFKYRS